MALPALLCSLLFPCMPGPIMPRPLLDAHRVIVAPRDLPVHLVERARNALRDVRDFDVAEDVFEFRGDAVASGNRFAERNCLSHHLAISAAGSANLQIRTCVRAALGTKQDR